MAGITITHKKILIKAILGLLCAFAFGSVLAARIIFVSPQPTAIAPCTGLVWVPPEQENGYFIPGHYVNMCYSNYYNGYYGGIIYGVRVPDHDDEHEHHHHHNH